MSIDRLRGHWDLSRTPFTKELATSMLFDSTAHQEAVARIGWIITQRVLGVVCGEVGAGKTVAARAASAGLDQGRHTTTSRTRRSGRAGSIPRSWPRSARHAGSTGRR